jgi:hypothetical protein
MEAADAFETSIPFSKLHGPTSHYAAMFVLLLLAAASAPWWVAHRLIGVVLPSGIS